MERPRCCAQPSSRASEPNALLDHPAVDRGDHIEALRERQELARGMPFDPTMHEQLRLGTSLKEVENGCASWVSARPGRASRTWWTRPEPPLTRVPRPWTPPRAPSLVWFRANVRGNHDL